jgi:hypothetical protein
VPQVEGGAAEAVEFSWKLPAHRTPRVGLLTPLSVTVIPLMRMLLDWTMHPITRA